MDPPRTSVTALDRAPVVARLLGLPVATARASCAAIAIGDGAARPIPKSATLK